MRISKQYFGLGTIALCSAFLAGSLKACDNRYKNEYKQKIEQTDSNRYKRIMSLPENNNSALWYREYKKMQDSLRLDSINKAGQQNGKDSLYL